MTMVSGEGDVEFVTNIIPSDQKNFNFNVEYPVIGFPSQGISGTGYYGVTNTGTGNTQLYFFFIDSQLPPGTYSGYVKILVSQGSGLSDSAFLNLKVTLTVQESAKG